jgi:(p)ppGpp synthase/HD superfamily hydrolase
MVNSITGVKINGIFKPLNTKLQNNDVVEVICKKGIAPNICEEKSN